MNRYSVQNFKRPLPLNVGDRVRRSDQFLGEVALRDRPDLVLAYGIVQEVIYSLNNPATDRFSKDNYPFYFLVLWDTGDYNKKYGYSIDDLVKI
jgi:hypothetical protein